MKNHPFIQILLEWTLKSLASDRSGFNLDPTRGLIFKGGQGSFNEDSRRIRLHAERAARSLPALFSIHFWFKDIEWIIEDPTK